MFTAPTSHEDLIFKGATLDDPWAEGEIVSAAGQVLGRVRSGVPDFVGTLWSDQMEAEKLPEWVRHGWDRKKACLADPMFRMLCVRALEGGPLRVDIATGPGGGLVPAILDMEPAASIMGSDIEIRTMVEWTRFARSKGIGSNLLFACFDACKMPLGEGCADVVCSDDGFSNIPFQQMALGEAFRTLRPGGLLVMRDEQVSGRSRSDLLALAGPQLSAALPGVIDGWAGLIESLGFNVELDEDGPARYLEPGESGLSARAAEKGIRIEVEAHYIIARR